MGGWSNATRHGAWGSVQREERAGLPCAAGRWTVVDVGLTIACFAWRWELGLAFLALKLWQQASHYEGSVFAFAREKWEALVRTTRSATSGVSMPGAFHFGARSTGNWAFDAWRKTELDRIEAERARLRAAEREFASYRDELLHAKDREDFERFMSARGGPGAAQ